MNFKVGDNVTFVWSRKQRTGVVTSLGIIRATGQFGWRWIGVDFGGRHRVFASYQLAVA